MKHKRQQRYDLVCKYCQRPIKRSRKEFKEIADDCLARGQDPAATCKACRAILPYIARTGLYEQEKETRDSRQG